MENKRNIYVPPEGPPRSGRPNPEIYAIMGQDSIFAMLADFYAELGKSEIRSLFPADMLAASKKSAAFFVFLLGGPPLYQQHYGPTMMRQRHLPFKIDQHARSVWLECFRKVLVDSDKKYGFPEQHKDEFMRFLEEFSQWMVNAKDV
jgi:hemoglobin